MFVCLFVSCSSVCVIGASRITTYSSTTHSTPTSNSETKRKTEIQLLPEDLNSPTQMITVKLAGTDKMSSVDKKFLSKVSGVKN